MLLRFTLALLLGLTFLPSVQGQTQAITVVAVDTLLISSPNPIDIPHSAATVTNTSSAVQKLIVTRSIDSIPAGQNTYFCFSIGCYAPFTDESTDTLTLAPGANDNSFKHYFTPNSILGQGSVRYTFRDVISGASARVHFRMITSVTATSPVIPLQALVISSLPATGTLSLAPAPGITIKLQDCLGRVVRTLPLTSIQTDINLQNLAPGTYLLTANDGRSMRIGVQ